MAESNVFHLFIGKHHQYEIVQTERPFRTSGITQQHGKFHWGSFDSIAKSVTAAEKEG
jgi:hypothetical protein